MPSIPCPHPLNLPGDREQLLEAKVPNPGCRLDSPGSYQGQNNKNTETQVHPHILEPGVGTKILKSSASGVIVQLVLRTPVLRAPSTRHCPLHQKFPRTGAETGFSTPVSPSTNTHAHAHTLPGARGRRQG